jgi:hypothetical protein
MARLGRRQPARAYLHVQVPLARSFRFTSAGSVARPKPGLSGVAKESVPVTGAPRLPKPAPQVAAVEIFPSAGSVTARKPGIAATAAVIQNAAFIHLPKPSLSGTVAVGATALVSMALPKPAPHVACAERIPFRGSVRIRKDSLSASGPESFPAAGSVRIPKRSLSVAVAVASQARGSAARPKPALSAACLEIFPGHGSVRMRKMTLSGVVGQAPSGTIAVTLPKPSLSGGGSTVRSYVWKAPDKLSRSGGVMR